MDVKYAILEGALELVGEVTRVEYDLQKLVINMEPSYNEAPIVVTFESVVGFRLLDEGDLCEFWKYISSKNGWLFQITAGGWHELESKRDGFLTQHLSSVHEYLVIGGNDCVSVLAFDVPKVARP